MRTDCRHYESRTYPSGETVRKCRLDLAPDAPWRCPDDCPKFEKRRWDAGWQYGSLGHSAKPPEAEPQGKEVDALLDEASEAFHQALLHRRILACGFPTPALPLSLERLKDVRQPFGAERRIGIADVKVQVRLG